MWRCINGEFLVREDSVKARFLDTRFRFMARAQGKVVLHSFCVLDNHYHESNTLLDESKYLSNWVRSAHSSFGSWLNLRLGRKGPVAQDRPKTLVVQDQEGLMRLMFYHDWNPVRAGLCEHPREYKFSSYRYYAHGEINSWTRHLTQPDWYVALADTPQQRQAAYQQLCQDYFDQNKLPDKSDAEDGHAFGIPSFMEKRQRFLNAVMRRVADQSIPAATLDRWIRNLMAWKAARQALTSIAAIASTGPPPQG